MKPSVYIVNNPADWAWPLRVPVKEGEPMPMELWFMYHANTLLPMQRKEAPSA